MDTQSTLKKGENFLGDRCYGNFTLRDIVEFYFSNAVDLAGSNGDAPTFGEYSHNMQSRFSDRFNLGNHRIGYLLAPLLGYSKTDGNGTVQNSPVEYRGVKAGHLRVYLLEGRVSPSVDSIVDTAIDEIGPELNRLLTQAFLIKKPEPIQPTKIESFESWLARVMNRSS